MVSPEKQILSTADLFNWVAAGALVIMMVLTCTDVVLRFFRHPIPGTYEIVGLLGTAVISFSLAYTTAKKGHIAVEFIVSRFTGKTQNIIDSVNNFLSLILFAVITWQSALYALDLRESGEVSLTVQIPIHPFVFGISAGCGLVCFVLALDLYKSIRRLRLK
ncbi:MAG: TRAP transporter small permease [Thermodesulfobacteriota bacterium]|nr:TRAP transporter small permease [Thermodesulfobacteriota bacterium]